LTVTAVKALDEMYAVFKTGIDSYAFTDFDYNIFWDDEESDTYKDSNDIIFRVKHFIVRQQQDTFATSSHERQFTTVGLLTVSIYVPRLVSNGQSLTREIANYVRSLYIESTESGVWFRDQMISTTTKQYDPNYYHTAVSVTYEYNELLA